MIQTGTPGILELISLAQSLAAADRIKAAAEGRPARTAPNLLAMAWAQAVPHWAEATVMAKHGAQALDMIDGVKNRCTDACVDPDQLVAASGISAVMIEDVDGKEHLCAGTHMIDAVPLWLRLLQAGAVPAEAAA